MIRLKYNDKIIAYHDDKKVIKRYIKKLIDTYGTDKDDYKIDKVSNNKYDENLYLVRHNDSYIQIKYYETMHLLEDGIIDDEVFARDILNRILETEDLSKSERKSLLKSIIILNDIIDSHKSEVLDIDDCDKLYTQFNKYT